MYNKIEPLYVLAKKKKMGDVQIMDSSTVSWIEANLVLKKRKMKKFVAKIPPMKVDKFVGLMPRLEWFCGKRHFESIHGFNHLSRAVIYAHILSFTRGESSSQKYLIAAGMHDIRRLNDREDIGHGNRSAEWILDNRRNFGLNEKDVREIFFMVKYHDVELDKIPEDIKNKFSHSISFLKAVDALDRYRLPGKKWWIDEKKISLKLSDDILNLAKNLVIEIEKMVIQEGQSREEVFIAVCQELGLME